MKPLSKTSRVAVVGGGISGSAACRLLRGNGFEVDLYDERVVRARQELESLGVSVFENVNTPIGAYDQTVLSPGIYPSSKLLTDTKGRILSEIDLAFLLIRPRRIIAVTGTNGKTTTVSLVERILRCSGVQALAVGNIGLAMCEFPPEEAESTVAVVEVSSYQLETSTEFMADVAVCLNISPDHLARHGSVENYILAKSRLFELQSKEGLAILNAASPLCSRFKPSVKGKLEYFGEARGVLSEYSLNNFQLIGKHNLENLEAAILAARHFGATHEGIQFAIDTFEPVPHRLEFVGKILGVDFINDSKATNVNSTLTALDAVSQKYGQVHLLLGGEAKGEDVSTLAGRAKFYCYGRDANVFSDVLEVEDVSTTLGEALEAAKKSAVPGDAILLSPACASFDQYKNFEERGAQFRSLVRGSQGK